MSTLRSDVKASTSDVCLCRGQGFYVNRWPTHRVISRTRIPRPRMRIVMLERVSRHAGAAAPGLVGSWTFQAAAGGLAPDFSRMIVGGLRKTYLLIFSYVGRPEPIYTALLFVSAWSQEPGLVSSTGKRQGLVACRGVRSLKAHAFKLDSASSCWRSRYQRIEGVEYEQRSRAVGNTSKKTGPFRFGR